MTPSFSTLRKVSHTRASWTHLRRQESAGEDWVPCPRNSSSESPNSLRMHFVTCTGKRSYTAIWDPNLSWYARIKAQESWTICKEARLWVLMAKHLYMVYCAKIGESKLQISPYPSTHLSKERQLAIYKSKNCHTGRVSQRDTMRNWTGVLQR